MASSDPSAQAPLVFETALEHVSAHVPVASPTDRVGEILKTLRATRFDTAAEVAVCDKDRKLKGLVNIEDLLAASEDKLVTELMDPDPPVVGPGTDQEVAAWKAVQHGESTLAVVDSHGCFIGLIPSQRLLEVLLREHDEDMARLGGFLGEASSARMASEEPVARRFWHRIPWLLVGLGGAVGAAGIVEAFEGPLRQNVSLAFFMPGVVYLADAVGTQTETLIVRGLSVGVSIRHVIKREILTGFLVGVALSVIFFPVAFWLWRRVDIALAVALSLFAACSIATIVAMALPWIFHRLGKDPAFGSGPLATVIQDLLTILIYFVIAINLVQ